MRKNQMKKEKHLVKRLCFVCTKKYLWLIPRNKIENFSLFMLVHLISGNGKWESFCFFKRFLFYFIFYLEKCRKKVVEFARKNEKISAIISNSV